MNEEDGGGNGTVDRGRWTVYVHDYIQSGELNGERPAETELLERLSHHPVLLMRNVRAGKKLLSTKIVAKNNIKTTTAGVAEAQFRSDLKIRFVVNTGEILIKDGAPQRARTRHELVVKERRERFSAWMKKNGSSSPFTGSSWLTDTNTEVRNLCHPELSYLTYRKYRYANAK